MQRVGGRRLGACPGYRRRAWGRGAGGAGSRDGRGRPGVAGALRAVQSWPEHESSREDDRSAAARHDQAMKVELVPAQAGVARTPQTPRPLTARGMGRSPRLPREARPDPDLPAARRRDPAAGSSGFACGARAAVAPCQDDAVDGDGATASCTTAVARSRASPWRVELSTPRAANRLHGNRSARRRPVGSRGNAGVHRRRDGGCSRAGGCRGRGRTRAGLTGWRAVSMRSSGRSKRC